MPYSEERDDNMYRRIGLLAFAAFVMATILALPMMSGCGKKAKEATDKKQVTLFETGQETLPDVVSTGPPKTQPTEATQPTGPSKEIEDTITAVAIDYAHKAFPDLPELTVVETKVLNDIWARVTLEPVDKSTDAASAYLKKTDGAWTVFDFGTGIMPADHPDTPAELFTES